MDKKPILLITGLTGRLGMRAAKLFGVDYHIIGLDIVDPADESIEYFFTDLSSEESVRDTMHAIKEKHGSHIAAVLHFAAYYNFKGGAWKKYEEITIGGTRHLLNALKEFTVDQFIFSSSLLVYAPCKLGEKITELSPLNPSWEYPKSKVITEEMIEKDSGEMPTVTLRIAGIYDDGCHSIPISQQMARIYEKQLESHFFPGNLKHGATFLHMDDLMSAIGQILKKRTRLSSHEVFVLGEPEVINYRTLQNQMGLLLHGKPWWTVRIPKWTAKIGASVKRNSFIRPWMIDLADDHYDVDTSKAGKLLDWSPKHRLLEVLPKMVEGLKRDPKKWYQEHG